MAGPILNLTVFKKSKTHTLRAIAVMTFPPAFLLLFIAGVTANRVNPAIGILPLFFSSAFNAFLLANENQCGCSSSGLTGTPIHLVFDLLLGIGVLVCIILTWIFLPNAYNGQDVMLGTYCTNFLITNFLIHLYFVVQELYETVIPGAARQATSSCPQCPSKTYGPFANVVRNAARDGYAPLLGESEPNGGTTGGQTTAEYA